MRGVVPGAAVAAHVWGEDPVVSGEGGGVAGEVGRGTGEAVEEEDAG